MQQYDLIALRSFITVVEVGSFNKAAELLSASTAAVSRRVSALESALGIKLLNRTTRQIDLTEAGTQFYDDVVNIFHSLDEAEEKIQQGREIIRGSLRIAAPFSFALQRLSPALPEFMKQYPELKVQLQLDDRTTDLVAEGIDLAIRIGSLKDSTLVATKITDVSRVCCVSPSYIQQYGEPEIPGDLNNHNCLHYSLSSTKKEWHFANISANNRIEINGSLSTNNGEVLKEAAIQGLGITLLPRFIVSDALANGRLMPILTHYNPEPYGLFAMRISRKFTPNKIRVMIEYLKKICADFDQ